MNKGAKIGIGIGIFVVAFLLMSFTAYMTIGKSQETETNQVIELPNEPILDSTPEPVEIYEPLVKVEEDPLLELKQFALEKINEDRRIAGLDPVKLSDNKAAQIHSEDVLKTKDISHWLITGEKPYMTYSQLGGSGYVSQNIAFRGIADVEQCNKVNVICEPLFPFEAIKNSQQKMVYDDAAANWGHRDNILDPYHTHVSLGISYDDYSLAYVQNFENNYIEFTEPIQLSNKKVRITGNLERGQLFNIGIYRDNIPSNSEYQIHKNDRSYGPGQYIAMIKEPPPAGSYYESPPSYDLIVSNVWEQNENSIEVEFDLSKVVTSKGVYTIVVWVSHNNEEFPITSYSFTY